MRWDEVRARLLVLAGCGALALTAVSCSDESGAEEGGDDDESAEAEAPADDEASESTTTTIDTGDLEISGPNGWREVGLPTLGFGLAIPEQWEAVVLSEDGLDALQQADPAVPGFADAAHATAETGGVFYAAGVEADDRVTDLKVRAATDTGITTAAALYGYARQLADEAGLVDASIRTVTDADRPTVVVRYSSDVERLDPDDPEAEPTTVTVEGSEQLVVSPNGVVYSLIVTSENPDGHDAFADRVFQTLAFPPADAAADEDGSAAEDEG